MSTSEEKTSKKPKMEYPPQLKWMLKRALEDSEGFWVKLPRNFTGLNVMELSGLHMV